MKRSKMLEELVLELQDCIMENYFDQKGEHWVANLLLTRLEELGMEPPTWSNHSHEEYGWEPEDNE